MKYILMIAALILISCSTHWVKPDGTPEGFQADKATCISESYAKFPVSNGKGVGPASVTTNCTKNANNVQCNSQQQDSFASQMDQATDHNQVPRDNAYKACLYSKGWTPQN